MTTKDCTGTCVTYSSPKLKPQRIAKCGISHPGVRFSVFRKTQIVLNTEH